MNSPPLDHRRTFIMCGILTLIVGIIGIGFASSAILTGSVYLPKRVGPLVKIKHEDSPVFFWSFVVFFASFGIFFFVLGIVGLRKLWNERRRAEPFATVDELACVESRFEPRASCPARGSPLSGSVMSHHTPTNPERLARLQRMTPNELRREIARCRAMEEQGGMPNKARRSWKQAKEDAEAELQRRETSAT